MHLNRIDWHCLALFVALFQLSPSTAIMQAPAFARPAANIVNDFSYASAHATTDTLLDTNVLISHQQYPHRLSMYTQPPQLEISIEQFEQFALDRLQGMSI